MGRLSPDPAIAPPTDASVAAQRRGALRVLVGYLWVAVAWILASDTLVELLIPNQELSARAQTVKGLLFVFASGALVYVLARRELRAAAAARTTSEEAARAIADAEQRYRLLYEEAPHAYMTAAADGTIRLANRQAGAMLRMDAADLVGRHVIDLFPDTPDGKRRAAALRDRYLSDNMPAEDELEMRAADGSPVWIRLTVIPLDARPGWEQGGTLGMAVDITAARADRESIRQERLRYQQLLESILDGVLVIQDERIVWANEPAAAITGRPSAKALVGMSPLGLLPSEARGRGRAVLEAVRSGETPRLLVDHAVTLAGVLVPLEGTIGRTTWNGEPALQFVFRDITDRTRAEEEQQSSKVELERLVHERTAELALQRDRAESADRLKSQFLASMSHELRTPLNAILGFAGVLLQGLAGALTEEQERQITIVRDAGRHLLSLINDILDLSKIEADQLRLERAPFSVSDAVEAAAQTLDPGAREKGLSLHIEKAADLGVVVGDRRRFEQVLLNLLGNAIRFTDHGGVVVMAQGGPDDVTISISDTGVGISPEQLEAAFEPFRQLDGGAARRHGGTGLGLAICRRLTTLMGGTVTATSVPGSGSTFTFRTPRRGATAPEEPT